MQLKIHEDIRPMSEFRAGIASFVKQINETQRPIVITQHGKGVGVLLSVDEYEMMQEKIELLQDIQVAATQLKEGQAVEHSIAKQQILSAIK